MASIDKLKIRGLVRAQSKIELAKIQEGGKTYNSYIVEIPADCFWEYRRNPHLLAKAVDEYASQLHEEILHTAEQDRPAELLLMSRRHIRNETMAHLIPWFLYGRRKGSGRIYNSCKEINLNRDENRWYVKMLMIFGAIIH